MQALKILAATILVTLPVFAQPDPQIRGVRNLPKGMTLEKARTHVIAPAHTRGIEAEMDVEAGLSYDIKKRPRVRPVEGKTPKLNVGDFGRDLDSILKPNTAGYAIEIRQNGIPIYGLVRGWAQTPNDRSLGWNGEVRMHVASVSKMLTAIGMIQLLDREKSRLTTRSSTSFRLIGPKAPTSTR